MKISQKLLFPVDLQYFSEGEMPFEDNPATVESVESEEVAPSQTEAQETEPQEDGIEQHRAFAKRLAERTEKAVAEERAKWQAEQAPYHQELQRYKTLSEQMMQFSGHSDLDSLQQALQQELLQAQAAQHQVPVEVMQRLNELERRAERADELEHKWQSQQALNTFYSDLDQFMQGKEDVTTESMIDYMVQTGLSNFDVAYKALRADLLEQKLATAQQDAVKQYLESKKAPLVEGAGSAPGVVADAPPKTWAESQQRALARLRAMNQQ
ncbi:MFS transporter [Brevibacillus brevis]|uniref:MFS transporter n=1 Tax=Brevibacillus brevis TaxID=1393 RepID=UPI0019029AD0|nr:MFS transporter [Brevibacillus brevis]